MSTHITTTLTLSLLLASATLAPTGRATDAARQDEQELQDEREDVALRIADFKQHLKQKGTEDLEAIGLVDEFLREFESFGPKDRADVVKVLDGALKEKRTKELEEGVPDDRLYYASATALGEMAPESIKPLMKWLDHKTFKRNERIRGRIAKSLGKTGAPEAIKPLLGLLEDKLAGTQASGAAALANFDEEEGKVRKEIFKELLDVLMSQKSKVDANTSDLEAYERWSIISGPFIATMQTLSGNDERVPEAWQRWWNKNKKNDWDA